VSLDKRAVQTYEFFVVIESIRQFNRAVPFLPYEIRMASGECYDVPHPDFISISPRGQFVVVIDDDRLVLVDTVSAELALKDRDDIELYI